MDFRILFSVKLLRAKTQNIKFVSANNSPKELKNSYLMRIIEKSESGQFCEKNLLSAL